MKKECTAILKKLTHKTKIFFTDRGNTSILLALKLAKDLDKTKLFFQDQGGWITYQQYAKKLKFEYEYLDTDYGLIDIKILENNLDKDSVLLINSMPGYFTLQNNMDKIAKLCKKTGCFLINDASGSIGKEQAKYGDLIIGSFGRWKPINIEYGGFIAFNNKSYENFFEDNFNKEVKDFYKDLHVKLKSLPDRLQEFDNVNKKVKKQLKDFDVIHRNNTGINVIVKTDSPEKKVEVLDFCKIYGYEYTLCPRYIRVLTEAISIEIKRL